MNNPDLSVLVLFGAPGIDQDVALRSFACFPWSGRFADASLRFVRVQTVVRLGGYDRAPSLGMGWFYGNEKGTLQLSDWVTFLEIHTAKTTT